VAGVFVHPDDADGSFDRLGISIDLASQLVDRGEAFFGRAAEPIAKIVSGLIVFVHPMYAYALVIHGTGRKNSDIVGRGAFLQAVRVEAILLPAGRPLILDQIRAGQNRDGQSFNLDGLAMLICKIKLDAADGGDDIDAPGRHADLKDNVALRKGRVVDLTEGCAKRIQRLIHSVRILFGRLDPNVDVVGRAGIAVSAHGVGAYEKELNLLL
jgi:hypothetical protein